jgi:hypothetical protein
MYNDDYSSRNIQVLNAEERKSPLLRQRSFMSLVLVGLA